MAQTIDDLDLTPPDELPDLATYLSRNFKIILDAQLASGSVDSVFGRSGDVVALLADYDSFFLTQAEADALYSVLAHTHASFDTHIADGTIHFTEAAISILEAQISDFQTYLLASAKAADSELLDGVDGSNYARTDIAETFTDDLTIQGAFYSSAIGHFSSGVSVPTATDVDIPWKTGVTDLDTQFIYRFRLVTVGTGTNTGASWLVWFDDVAAEWQERFTSRAGNSSNHPLLKIDTVNGRAQAFHNHASTYGFRVTVDYVFVFESDAQPNVFGADYMWQRDINALVYPDGNVDISAGNLTLSGTVDGRNIDTDGTKLDTIETDAKDDQTAGEIEAIVSHDNLQGVAANEHFLQSAISITLSQVSDSGALAALNSVGLTEINDDSVTFLKLQPIGPDTLVGRVGPLIGDALDLPMATVRTMLNIEDGATQDQTGAEIEALIGALGALDTVNTAQIDNEAVTLAKMQHIPTANVLGRIAGGSGDVEDLTQTQVTTLINIFTDALKGLVPNSGGGTSNFLRADGSWVAPPGGGAPVASVFTRTGAVVALTGDYAAFYLSKSAGATGDLKVDLTEDWLTMDASAAKIADVVDGQITGITF